jgi:hypothetical protein
VILPIAVIVDIDGTLAIRGDGPGIRRFYDWHRVGEDQPNPAIIELVRTLYRAGKHHIILVSGRDEVCRPQTVAWLEQSLGTYDDLFMRPHGDNRKDSIVKRELYEQHVAGRYDVRLVIDDRNQVVEMWRSIGLTVLQCADGDF